MNPRYLKLELDQPEIIALKYPTARLVNGFEGPQLRWILMDGRALYTPVELQAKLEAIKPGVRLEIAKRRQGREIVWHVGPAEPQKQPAAKLLDATGSLDDPRGPIAPIRPSSPPKPGKPPETPLKPAATVTRLEDALKTAVQAAAAAEKHAETLGYACRFSPSDIRAMGISVLISMGRSAA